MATLQSPGVQVQVIDESFYTPAAPGTVPLIFVASASNKSNASGTGTAPGTLAANAGKVWTITGQRDLADTFGTPLFYTDSNGNPVNGGELNEYGLQAAYSLLGVSSKAYVVRGDMDLAQLIPSASVPSGETVSGTYWIDTDDSLYGINEWDATNDVFVTKTPLIIDDSNASSVASLDSDSYTPNQSFGSKGDYAVVITKQNTNQVWYKNNSNIWVVVGSNRQNSFPTTGSTFNSTSWQTSFPVAVSTGFTNVNSGTTVAINGTTITIGQTLTPAAIASSINGLMYNYGVGAKVNADGLLELYADATAKSDGVNVDGRIQLADGSGLVSSLGLEAKTYSAVTLTIAPHTQVPQYGTGMQPTGSVYIKTTSPNLGANFAVKYYSGATQTWGTVTAPIYASTEAAVYNLDKAGGKNIAVGSLFIESNYDHGTGASTGSVKLAEFKVYRRAAVSPTTVSVTVTTSTFASSSTSVFTIAETVAGSATLSAPKTISIAGRANLSAFATAVSAAGLTNVSATYDASVGTVSLTHKLGGSFTLTDGANTPLAFLGFSAYNMTTRTGTANLYGPGKYDTYTFKASNWKPLVYEAKATRPVTTPVDGQLWYSSIVDEVDIMYHNGTTWVGYLNAFPTSDPKGPQVSALAPTTQSDGTPLVEGDIWISTADIELYGQDIYVWNANLLQWVKQDTTDQTTPNGWLFADARWSGAGDDVDPDSIQKLLSYNYLDPDAPDPALYPQGMHLWNLRRSGYNVKKYVKNYINIYDNNGINRRVPGARMDGSQGTTAYFADRWVTKSPNAADGSGSFGRHAQRSFVVSGFKALIDTNQAIRDTNVLVFNLIACPGYPEAIQNMVAFNVDRKQTAFIVGDTPFRLASDGTSLAAWGNNLNGAFDNNDKGGVSYDEFMAMFYPSGYTNDNTGNYIVVPPSHMMLRTITNSDAKSFQWFAPAGLRRGGIDNATAVGYLKDGEFQAASLPESIRDVLAGVKINPITTFPGSGIVNFGNYTRARTASSLDRINVARLVCYLRRQLDILARPFLFEPNDRITRNEIKAATESLLLELVGQRALYDFIVVCDESNNTPSRIDRSELWLDIAIEPVKAVEFIYIPLRLKNTGDIKAGL